MLTKLTLHFWNTARIYPQLSVSTPTLHISCAGTKRQWKLLSRSTSCTQSRSCASTSLLSRLYTSHKLVLRCLTIRLVNHLHDIFLGMQRRTSVRCPESLSSPMPVLSPVLTSASASSTILSSLQYNNNKPFRALPHDNGIYAAVQIVNR